jgi:carbamate kinase
VVALGGNALLWRGEQLSAEVQRGHAGDAMAAVLRDWGTDAARPIRRATPSELRSLTFAAGSMGPKVEAACRFVEATGGAAGIGSLEDAAAIVAGHAGTLVVPDAEA